LEFNVPFQQKYGYIRDELTTGNICTKNYWNPTAIVEIIIGGWVVSFFWDTVYIVLSCICFTRLLQCTSFMFCPTM